MYENYYHLSSDPFRLLPDPGICFPHRSGSRAWAYLRYALKRGEGIVVVTGPPGSGKTTLAQRLIGETNPAQVVTVRLVANDLTPTDLLRKLAYALGLPVEGKDRAMLSLLIERHLVEVQHAHRRVLVVIDEAQTLSHQSLEAMRLLTDLQSQTRPVLQLVLFGQEELEGAMSAPGMEQFQHRVIASCRLQPMDLMETKAYLEYRLGAMNWRGDPSINGPAVMAIFRYSHGVPRHVNKICSRLLLHGSSEERHALDERDVMAVVRDLRSELLAPLTHDVETQDPTINALSSVYELALVPSATPIRHDSVQTAYALEESRLDDDSTQAPPTGPDARRRAPRRFSYSNAQGRNGYPLRVGRRSGLRLRYRLGRRLRAQRENLLRLLGRLRKGKQDLGQWIRPLVIEGLAKLRDRVGHTRQQLSNKWPQIRAVAARRVWGQPVGLMAGATASVLLVALIAIRDADSLPEAAGISPQVSVGVAALGEHDTLAGGVLADSTVYLWSAQDTAARHMAGSTDLVAYLLGDLLGDETGGIQELHGLVGSAVALPRLRHAAGEMSVVAGGPELQPLLGAISDSTASRLLTSAGRYDSSLAVWVLARHPDAASDELINVWNLHPATGEASLQGVVYRGPEDEATKAVGSPDASDGGSVESAAGARTAADGLLTHKAAEVEKAISAGFVADNPGSQDYTRLLPPTASGGEDGYRSASESPVGAEDAAPTQPLEGAVATSDESDGPAVVADSGQSSDRMVEIDLAADANQASQPESLPVSVQEDLAVEQVRDDVGDLIALADEAIAADRLLMPKDRSAYQYLQQVLAIDADNAVAKRGLVRISERYAVLATRALQDESYDRAERYVSRGLRVSPGSGRLSALGNEVRLARERAEAVALAEAEMARLAAQREREPEPVAPPPPKKKPSSFEQLMRLVEGI